tara:strand:- start:11237 stop:11437 length:201 start_codon:yes stop_codon:yes gene_type:complete
MNQTVMPMQINTVKKSHTSALSVMSKPTKTEITVPTIAHQKANVPKFRIMVIAANSDVMKIPFFIT